MDKSEILYRYPLPIAVPYLNADNAREPVGAHDLRLRLFEVTLKFLSSIAIAQYLADRLEDARVKSALRGLARPSLGQWNGFLREVLNAYRRVNRIEQMFIPELADAYDKKRRDRPAMVRAYNEIMNLVENRSDSATQSLSLRQFADAMILYRNKTVGHGAITRYHCERMNGMLFEALEEMLAQLEFLKEHRLVYIEDVRVRRGSYAHEMMSFMGSTPPARMKEAYVTENPDEYRVEEQLYLCARDTNVPMLSLHPLVIAWQGDILILNESERERGIEYLSYQTGQIKKPDRLLEDFKEILGFVIGDDRSEPSFEQMRQQAIEPEPALASPYEQGCEAFEDENWATAAKMLAQVGQGEEHYAEAQAKLQETRRQQDLAARYQAGQKLIAERQWDQAQEKLEHLSQEQPSYRDVAGLLETIQVEKAREQSLQRLYEQALEALDARQWELAADLLRRLHDLRPDFRNVGTLLARQQRLDQLYEQAVESMADRRWVEAEAALRQLDALERGYKNLDSLLERTRQALELEAQVARWYSQAKAHIALEEWEQALSLLDQVDDQQKGYRDVGELIERVQAQIAITCPQCGALVPSGYKFCSRCGAAIETWVCWRCQSPVPEERKFCGRCGAPRQPPAAIVCPRCAYKNPLGRKFCGKCGELLKQP
jgi:outer membrane protein assembly factor BamD (BamD/ComL family)